jgi:hypothetical protein
MLPTSPDIWPVVPILEPAGVLTARSSDRHKSLTGGASLNGNDVYGRHLPRWGPRRGIVPPSPSFPSENLIFQLGHGGVVGVTFLVEGVVLGTQWAFVLCVSACW